MPPNPSKSMAPVQIHSPSQKRQKANTVIGLDATTNTHRERINLNGQMAAKDRGHSNRDGRPNASRGSPKMAQISNQRQSPTMPPHKQPIKPAVSPSKSSQYAGRKSVSPEVGSYAGAKFSEAPTPDKLPMPPSHWLSTFSMPVRVCSGVTAKSCPPTFSATNGQSPFDQMAKDLKTLLKVES